MKKGYIILVALVVALGFSLTIHYVTASNSFESRVANILDTHNKIIKLQEHKKGLCDGLGTSRDVRLEGICSIQVIKQGDPIITPDQFYDIDSP